MTDEIMFSYAIVLGNTENKTISLNEKSILPVRSYLSKIKIFEYRNISLHIIIIYRANDYICIILCLAELCILRTYTSVNNKQNWCLIYHLFYTCIVTI